MDFFGYFPKPEVGGRVCHCLNVPRQLSDLQYLAQRDTNIYIFVFTATRNLGNVHI